MLTRKYYKMIAKVISDNTAHNDNKRFADSRLYKYSLIDDLCNEFKEDNSLFDCDKFGEACD
tara:strand:+ start:1404 stop:1589 length:186 start_codon:yes stop_codon:yes gene_type:complete